MPGIDEVLAALKKLAKQDPSVRARLLQAAGSDHPVEEFCRVSTELGYPVSAMDLINAGEEYYANMRRSTNGGGENSPLLQGEDDYYEIFIAELKSMN